MTQLTAENCQTSENPQGASINLVKEISPSQACQVMQNEKALLVDVRTEQELVNDGQPNTSEIGGESINIPWRLAPDFEANHNFINQLKESAPKDTTLLFLCRSGGRSYEATAAANEAGFASCFNVTDGMEGQKGWKASKLAWGVK